ncbi:hypothetical protein HZH66_011185 [Vespula vulgaris]|uniref:Uncharacterized protein n=1 Tax=Vespula vulgaris TaxID=7454 RepID=A0A834MXI4_VESVU|nr:hypothetical protein HZH66_011185 [Vespula vulgaris]
MQMRDPRFGLGLDWQIARGAALRLKLPDGTTPSNNNKKKKKKKEKEKKKKKNKKEPSENEDDDGDDEEEEKEEEEEEEEEEENEAVRAHTSLKVDSGGVGDEYGDGSGIGDGPLGPDVVPLPPAIHYELSVRCSFSGQRESFACRDTTVRSASRFRG